MAAAQAATPRPQRPNQIGRLMSRSIGVDPDWTTGDVMEVISVDFSELVLTLSAKK